MNVEKHSGELAPFDPSKVRLSILRTGANEAVADRVLTEIEPKLYDGITTAKLYHIVHETLRKQSVCFACRYSLRDALMALGPAGFNFEYYIAALLRAHNHDAHVPKQDIQGACVSHEVDVVSEKDGRRVFIEAKFRNQKEDYVDLKDTMATWSRFLDLVDGSAMGKCDHFDGVWIVTNARFSRHARQFGECKGMHLVGWNYPEDHSIAAMVDEAALYPVTAVDEMEATELEAFAKAGLILCKDIVELEPEELARRTDISTDRAEHLIDLAAAIVEG